LSFSRMVKVQTSRTTAVSPHVTILIASA
jgi:hypothetical protein